MQVSDGDEGGFVPLHDAHAIEQVSLTVQFDKPLSDEVYAAGRKALLPFQNRLPAKQDIRSLTIAIGVMGGAGPINPGAVEQPGLQLYKVASNGTLEKELRYERGGVSFRSTVYTRWNEVWSEAREYLLAVMNAFPQEVQVANIGLTFVDKFVWQGPLPMFSARKLLNLKSPYVSPYIFETADMFHNHTGAFLQPDEFTKRLLNINLDCLDEPHDESSRRVIQFTTVMSDMFNRPGLNSIDLTQPMGFHFVETRMSELHGYLLKIFADLINEKMQERIALKVSNVH